jgi:hypothetical protein
MKKGFYHLLLASLFLLLLGPIAAFAQIQDHLEVTVPFPFYVENTQMPAGTYTIQPLGGPDPSALLMRSADAKADKIMMTLPIHANGTVAKSALDFDKIGNKDVLTEIWVANADQGYRVLENGSKVMAGATKGHREHRTVEAQHKTK